jgi:starch synthase
MNILLASPEMAPFAKTGGLADVTGSLPRHLCKNGIEVSVVIPKYKTVAVQSKPVGDIHVEIGSQVVSGTIEQSTITGTDIPVFLVCNEPYFNRDELYTVNGKDYPDNLERYTFFCRAILEMIKQGWVTPDLIHANDWQTALLPIYIKTKYRRDPSIRSIKTLYTIHNLAYQGVFPQEQLPITNIGWEHFHMEALEFYSQINLMKGAIVFSDAINTVSPKYAEEIQTPEFGCGLEGVLQMNEGRLHGILNGVDYTNWSPEHDTLIAAPYSLDTYKAGKARNKEVLLEEFQLRPRANRTPLFASVSRLAEQKGFDLVVQIVPKLAEHNAQLAILGTGQPEIEEQLLELQSQYPETLSLMIEYDNQIAHLIEAGADIFLMPSRYEPCGLNQMYSLRYGTIPLVRSTGGLTDTIRDATASAEGTGFMFDTADAATLWETCQRAMTAFHNETLWDQMIRRAMNEDFSWNRSAMKYQQLYTEILSV